MEKNILQNNRHPIIIGAAQFTQRKQNSQHLDPLKLMVKTCKKTFNDVNSEKVKEFIDAIYMINIKSWSYEDAPGMLSKTLGLTPNTKVYLPDGGNTPQMLANRAAKAITSGKLRAVLLTGAESAYSLYNAQKGRITLNWPERKEPSYMEGEIWDGTTTFENDYKFKFPPNTYALFETAVRKARGRSLEEHEKKMGKLFEHFSQVASINPYSWNQDYYTAEEITTASPSNRSINYPYTKRMCSNMFVDQSASLIMTSVDLAKELDIKENNWVYLMGGADLKNLHEVTLRPRLYDSPASRKGSKLALKQAGLTLEDINVFELYSCFPSIVEIMMNEIGIPDGDPRDLTLTGGLPFFGGPWSNYSMHGIVSAVEHVRKNQDSRVMVVANGGYNSKQSFGIYGKSPPTISWNERDDSKIQVKILADRLPEPIKKASGKLMIEAYTITHDRKDQPKEAIIIGRLESGARSIGFLRPGNKTLLKLEKEELIGRIVEIHHDPTVLRNLITLVE